MAPNPLDHSYVLDINLTINAELADKFYDASKLGGYKNKRLTQLQVLLANLISNHQSVLQGLSIAEGINDQLCKEELLYHPFYHQPVYSGAWVRLQERFLQSLSS